MKSPKCRFCNHTLKTTFVDLGKTPLANSFLDKNSLNKKEPIYPLHVFVCENCFLVQLPEIQSPDKIFSNYAYFSSYSQSWLDHAKNYVSMMTRKFNLDRKSFVIEIASNDGYLLQYFKAKKIPCLGIEPAKNVAKLAKKRGIETLVTFFGSVTARKLASEGKRADLLLGNNVLAHVPNINDFVAGLKILLKENGIITMEFPHLMRLINHTQFDTIYHEHFSYLSFFVVRNIFAAHGLKIFDVEELPTHGGSLRIYATHEENNLFKTSKKMSNLLVKEEKLGITKLETYTNFQRKVERVRKDLIDFITRTKKLDKKIVAYGAAAKGNTLLNYVELGKDAIEYVVDRNPHKQGLYLPGIHIPVKAPEEIHKTKPDYLVILPWNLKDEIMTQMDYIRNWSGKFVVLIPEVKIYS